jgi:glycerol-3-phosphate dehydrogenase (NAD(P)+)
MTTITILGAGVMGTAMTLPASDRGHKVRLVGTHLDRDIIAAVQAGQPHPRLGVRVPDAVTAFHHTEFAAALGDSSDIVLLGVSSVGIGWAIDRLCEALRKPIPVLMITKGIHADSERLQVLPDFVADEIARRLGFAVPVAAIGGPCIAGELAARRHTGTVITSRDIAFARQCCSLLATDYYHPRESEDVTGVEVCAAFKNFYAIAVGWAAGALETLPPATNRALNHNAAAILFDQAVAELLTLVTALGGHAESVFGMPGCGDLYVTCQAGRNSRLGNNLGRGLSYEQVKNGPMRADTIEGAELGVAAAATLRQMMAGGHLDPSRMPLMRALLNSLTENRPLTIAWQDLHR